MSKRTSEKLVKDLSAEELEDLIYFYREDHFSARCKCSYCRHWCATEMHLDSPAERPMPLRGHCRFNPPDSKGQVVETNADYWCGKSSYQSLFHEMQNWPERCQQCVFYRSTALGKDPDRQGYCYLKAPSDPSVRAPLVHYDRVACREGVRDVNW